MVLSQCDSPFVTKYYGSFLKVNTEQNIVNFFINANRFIKPELLIGE